MRRHDPLANPAPLIDRVYSYVAYRIGDGPDAEDVTSDVFERAIRYRNSYDPARGDVLPWLLGIARRCVDDHARRVVPTFDPQEDNRQAPGDIASDTVRKLSLSAAIGQLDERSRDLLALRFGADLATKQIAEVVGLKANAVDVALHRTLAQLRLELDRGDEREGLRIAPAVMRGTSHKGG
jgi:RNA polymerase sigma-70 factor (ECF subfamily)